MFSLFSGGKDGPVGFADFVYKHIVPACFLAPLKQTFDLADAQTVLVCIIFFFAFTLIAMWQTEGKKNNGHVVLMVDLSYKENTLFFLNGVLVWLLFTCCSTVFCSSPMLKIKLENCRFENLTLTCITCKLTLSESERIGSSSLGCLGFSCDR